MSFLYTGRLYAVNTIGTIRLYLSYSKELKRTVHKQGRQTTVSKALKVKSFYDVGRVATGIECANKAIGIYMLKRKRYNCNFKKKNPN